MLCLVGVDCAARVAPGEYGAQTFTADFRVTHDADADDEADDCQNAESDDGNGTKRLRPIAKTTVTRKRKAVAVRTTTVTAAPVTAAVALPGLRRPSRLCSDEQPCAEGGTCDGTCNTPASDTSSGSEYDDEDSSEDEDGNDSDDSSTKPTATKAKTKTRTVTKKRKTNGKAAKLAMWQTDPVKYAKCTICGEILLSRNLSKHHNVSQKCIRQRSMNDDNDNAKGGGGGNGGGGGGGCAGSSARRDSDSNSAGGGGGGGGGDQ